MVWGDVDFRFVSKITLTRIIIMYLLTIWEDQITVKTGCYDHHIQIQISLKLVSIKWSISKWDMTDGLREWNVIDHLSSSCFWFGCKIAVIEQLDENYNKFSSFSFARCLTKATPFMNSPPYSWEKFNISEAVNSFFFCVANQQSAFPHLIWPQIHVFCHAKQQRKNQWLISWIWPQNVKMI